MLLPPKFILCESCRSPFRLAPIEVRFYKERNLGFPAFCRACSQGQLEQRQGNSDQTISLPQAQNQTAFGRRH